MTLGMHHHVADSGEVVEILRQTTHEALQIAASHDKFSDLSCSICILLSCIAIGTLCSACASISMNAAVCRMQDTDAADYSRSHVPVRDSS